MSGIYIHIPFCRQACHYCDFHFSTNLKLMEEVVDAICQELRERAQYLSTPIETIYFGGGTPSLLEIAEIDRILSQLRTLFDLSTNPEITLEANPEDLSISKSKALMSVGINRLSIGFQTFETDKLKWMNRAHSVLQSYEAYQNVRKAGFNNVSLDLMYALPEVGTKIFQGDLKKVIDLQPEHISLYGLTIEDQTVFGARKERGQLVEIPEERAAEQYLNAIDMLRASGYVQYEVSNFGKRGFSSRHNTNYWNHIPYLGVGPGAHSYNQVSRRFNVRNNPKYVKAIQEGHTYFEEEQLSRTAQLNERILTGLRTANGINCEEIEQLFNVDLSKEKMEFLSVLSRQNLIKVTNNTIKLEATGFLVADEIALQLFFHE